MIDATANTAPEARPEMEAHSASDADPVTHADPELDAYKAAKELAESYDDLLKQKEAYRGRMGHYPHYTLDDAYYLLTQGAHAQAERVQTSTLSDPTARAVEKAEKLMNRLNREMDAEYREEVLDPYLDVCEKVELFNLCMDMLSTEQLHIAKQLYVQHRPKKYVTDQHGRRIPKKKMDQEIHTILTRFSEVLQDVEHARRKEA